MTHTVVEPALIEEFELKADVTWQIRITAPDNDRGDEHVVFVDEARPNGMRGEGRTAHRDILGRFDPAIRAQRATRAPAGAAACWVPPTPTQDIRYEAEDHEPP